ncbi:unnamed protein product, partial [Choristocarpus tenellus]
LLSATLVQVLAVVVVDTLVRRAKRQKGDEEGWSGMYSGRVWHARYKPEVHHFSYPIFLCLLDLDKLSGALPW